MAIDFTGSASLNPAAQALARLALVAARPSFEVRFNAAQNKALERLDKQIEKFQTSDFGRGKTALFRIKYARLERGLELAQDFKEFASTNRQTVKDVLTGLTDLRALADPATAAEYDTKRTEVLAAIEKLLTANITGLGAPDGLRALKEQAETDLAATDVSTAGGATAAQTTIDDLTLDFTAKLDILELNQDSANSLVTSNARVLEELKAKIDDIEIAERRQEIDRIKAIQEELSRVFTSLSVNFEGSQFLGDYVAKSGVLEQRVDPGSVVNLFA